MEEDWIKRVCDQIAALKPDLVVTEKGLSDLAMHYLAKNNIAAIRRLRKTDNNRCANSLEFVLSLNQDQVTVAKLQLIY